MSDSYTLTVEKGIVDGQDDYFITLPDELLEVLDISPGEYVLWTDNNDGSFSITKSDA